MKLEAVFDAVIVKPIDLEDTMYGNIIVPDLGKEKSLIGEVVSVGPGKRSITGDNFLPTTVKKKTTVISYHQQEQQDLNLKEMNIIYVQNKLF